MAYKDFSDSYIAWLNSQLDYVNGGLYSNFFVTIDPIYEVTSFKQSVDINQQQVFHNAADDQVGYKRQINEINKTPLDYLLEYEDSIKFELELVNSTAKNVDTMHKIQESTSKSTLQFYANFAPKALDNLSKYNPSRILE